jgi:hypothetical protein
MLFMIKNRKEFTDNTEMYEIKTRQQKNLHQPFANLKKYQKGIHYLGIKAYNNLPSHIKDMSNEPRKFEIRLKQILQIYFFYSLQEYINCGFLGHEV